MSARTRSTTSSSAVVRSEEHTSELQSLRHIVCRLLLEKKNNKLLNVQRVKSQCWAWPLVNSSALNFTMALLSPADLCEFDLRITDKHISNGIISPTFH